jgi:sigma-B regulation protein RsbU (phosphoserine phosphatase)
MVPDAAPREAIVDSAAIVVPTGQAPVGGDFQLIRDVGPSTVAVVGDVTGSGADASRYADRLCAELGKAAELADPVAVLEKLNRDIHADPGFDRFVTACVVVIDRANWSANWAFAGHLPPHWLDTGLPLDGATPGLPLGVEETCGAVSAELRPLRPGEGMLLFTDGLEDVKGPGGDRFGSARITHTLARMPNGASADEVVRTLKDVACGFGNGELPDDLCLMALRIA